MTKTESFSSDIRYKAGISTFTSSLQHSVGNTSKSNQTRKINKTHLMGVSRWNKVVAPWCETKKQIGSFSTRWVNKKGSRELYCNLILSIKNIRDSGSWI